MVEDKQVARLLEYYSKQHFRGDNVMPVGRTSVGVWGGEDLL